MRARSSRLLSLVAVEVLAGREQACQQERGLDEVAAVVLGAERDRPPAVAVEEVRQDAVVAVGLEQEADHGQEALERRGAADPAAADAHDDRHDAEAAAAGGDDLGAVVRTAVAALAREPAGGVGEVPEVAQRLPLHQVEQGALVQIRGAGHGSSFLRPGFRCQRWAATTGGHRPGSKTSGPRLSSRGGESFGGERRQRPACPSRGSWAIASGMIAEKSTAG